MSGHLARTTSSADPHALRGTIGARNRSGATESTPASAARVSAAAAEGSRRTAFRSRRLQVVLHERAHDLQHRFMRAKTPACGRAAPRTPAARWRRWRDRLVLDPLHPRRRTGRNLIQRLQQVRDRRADAGRVDAAIQAHGAGVHRPGVQQPVHRPARAAHPDGEIVRHRQFGLQAQATARERSPRRTSWRPCSAVPGARSPSAAVA